MRLPELQRSRTLTTGLSSLSSTVANLSFTTTPAEAGERFAALASGALLDELHLSPKPGLVDLRGSGAHADMSVPLMEASIRTIAPAIGRIGEAAWGTAIDVRLRSITAAIGREAERDMLDVTGGVNTHRGAIWALGLIAAAAAAIGPRSAQEDIAAAAGQLASLPDEGALWTASVKERNGQRVHRLYGLPGAREEAIAGFPHVIRVALPRLRFERAKGLPEDVARLHALLDLMAALPDTCIASRAGLEGLAFTQASAMRVLRLGGLETEAGERAFLDFDRAMTEQRLSPGGSADLLATALFIERIPDAF